MATILLVPLLLSSVLGAASITQYPFLIISLVEPTMPQVFDVVGVTVHVESELDVPVCEMSWDFGDGTYGSSSMNNTGVFEFTTFHIFSRPGDYYMRMSVLDALNRTAQDVQPLFVDRQTCTLFLSVSPVSVLNTTELTRFTLEADLKTKTEAVLADRAVMFWYSSDGADWLQITAAKTNGAGQAVVFFKPPFEGGYYFRVTFEGDDLYAPAEVVRGEQSIVTPELPSLLVMPLLLFSTLLFTRRRWKLR